MANYALSFDGSDDYVDCGNGSSLIMGAKDFSVGLWFKQDKADVSRILVTKGGAFDAAPYDNKGWAIAISGNTNQACLDTYKVGLRRALYSNKVFLSGENGKWFHLVVIKSGTVGKIYINGQLDKSGSAVDVVEDSVYSVSIGVNYSAWRTGYFPGSIDDVRIYNRALSADEIQALYFGKEVDSTGLVGWWKFDEGSGTTAIDSSGNGNNGTLMNGPTYTEFPTRIVGAGSLQI